VDVSLSDRLEAARDADGGFGPVPSAASEPEATALAALALDDEPARSWLVSAQDPDGAVTFTVGGVTRDVTAASALAMAPGAARERALARLVSTQGRNGPGAETPGAFGWPWTLGAHGWVEPTAWGLLALRGLRPDAARRIDDARRMLAGCACVGGGWNYGSREALGVDLPPFAQTTALAVIALAQVDPDLADEGLGVLRRIWRGEAAGLLTAATAAAAFRATRAPEASEAAAVLRAALRDDPGDTVALAWASIALGDGLERVVHP
jgi:hypothetical protein